MIFRRNGDFDDDDEEEEDIEYVLFQGAVNGKDANLEENRKLAAAGLSTAKELVSDALAQRCDSVRIEAQGERMMASFFVDGIRSGADRFPRKRGNAVIQILKLLSGLDVNVRDEPQTGGIKAEYREFPFEITVKTKPGKGGESAVLMFRMTKISRTTPDDIGIPQAVQNTVGEYAASRQGIILIAGPPESGLTTTALCTLRCADSYQYSCFILGDIGNREVLNVPVFEPEEGHSLEETIMRIRRNDGDLLYFDNFNDADTVKTAIPHAENITIMSEITANSAADGITKFVELAGDPGLVAENLSCVVGFRLIRKLCTKCREAFRPSPRLLRQIGLDEDTQTLYRTAPPPEPDPRTGEEPLPCRACDGTGFRGRVAIFELIDMTEGMKQVVMSGGDAAAIRARVREEKQLTLQQDALRLVLEGVTGLEELQRAFRPPQRKKKPAKKKRPRR